MAMNSTDLGNRIADRILETAAPGIHISPAARERVRALWRAVAQEIVTEVLKAQTITEGVEAGTSSASGRITA